MDRIRFGLPVALDELTAARHAAAIEGELAQFVGARIEARVASSYCELREWLTSGRVDMAWAPPTLCAEMIAHGVERPLLLSRRGATSYRGAVVVRTDAALSLGDFDGLVAAWVDPYSMAGYLLPLMALERAGVAPEAAFREERFHGSYRAVLEAVLSRRADVGAAILSPSCEAPPPFCWRELVGPRAAELALLAFSDASPNDGIVASPAVSPACTVLAARLAEAPRLLSRRVLQRAFDADGVEPVGDGQYRPALEVFRRHEPALVAPPSALPRGGQLRPAR